MGSELYIVNTTIRPYFLDMFTKCEFRERAIREHVDFIEKVREQHPRFDLPYLAFFQDGHLEIPHDLMMGGTIMGGVQGGIADDMPLDEFIDKFAVGKGTIWTNQDLPITAVVEFSSEELYPEAMKKLEKKYDIKRIQLE